MLSRNKWKDGVMRRDEGLEELAGVTNGPRPAGGTMQLWTWGDGRPARWDQDASLCCHGAAASQGEAPGLHTHNLYLAIILQKRHKTREVKFFFFFFIVKGSQLLYFHFHVLPSNLSCPFKAEQWPGRAPARSTAKCPRPSRDSGRWTRTWAKVHGRTRFYSVPFLHAAPESPRSASLFF